MDDADRRMRRLGEERKKKADEKRAKEGRETEERKQQVANIEKGKKDWVGKEKAISMAVTDVNQRTRPNLIWAPTLKRPKPDGRTPPIPQLPGVRITRHDRQPHEMTIGINDSGKVEITDTTNGAARILETAALDPPEIKRLIVGFIERTE
jgi:hypothetical protein